MCYRFFTPFLHARLHAVQVHRGHCAGHREHEEPGRVIREVDPQQGGCCLRVCIYMYTYIRYTYTVYGICVYGSTTRLFACVDVRWAGLSTNKHIGTRARVHARVHSLTHTHACTHTYAHSHTHSHTHTNTVCRKHTHATTYMGVVMCACAAGLHGRQKYEYVCCIPFLLLFFLCFYVVFFLYLAGLHGGLHPAPGGGHQVLRHLRWDSYCLHVCVTACVCVRGGGGGGDASSVTTIQVHLCTHSCAISCVCASLRLARLARKLAVPTSGLSGCRLAAQLRFEI